MTVVRHIDHNISIYRMKYVKKLFTPQESYRIAQCLYIENIASWCTVMISNMTCQKPMHPFDFDGWHYRLTNVVRISLKTISLTLCLSLMKKVAPINNIDTLQIHFLNLWWKQRIMIAAGKRRVDHVTCSHTHSLYAQYKEQVLYSHRVANHHPWNK